VNYLILALADDNLIFDRAHAAAMNLPFERGWAAWHVFHRNGRDLRFIDSFDAYGKAQKFIEKQPVLTVELSNVLH
jgi:hypothetical protein